MAYNFLILSIEIPEDIGKRIQRVRKRKAVKSVPLAKAVFISQPNLSQIENNKNFPSERTLILLAKELKDDFGIPSLRKHIENAKGEEVVIFGKVAAGKPLQTFDDPDTIFIPEQMVARTSKTIALIISGDSMKDVGIRDRDIVILHKIDEIPTNGTIVVVRIGEGEASEFTIKKWFKHGSKVTLRAENREFDDIEIETETTPVHVEGKFAGLIRFGG